jgi:hypothetical protein
MLDWMDFFVTAFIASVGLYLANSFRRHQRLKIADQRLEAYRALWELMEVARPTRIDEDCPVERGGPLTQGEARSLYRAMTHWYYGSGNGMLLPDETKRVYLEAKRRLAGFAAGSEDWMGGGERRIRELSLLRTQMKVDLAIYGMHYFEGMEEGDANSEFLRSAHIEPQGWARPGRDRRRKRATEAVRRILARLRPSGAETGTESATG